MGALAPVAPWYRWFKAAIFTLLAADAGEEFACREMRKQFCAYTKGIAGGAAVRNRLVHACTVAEYGKILLEAKLLPASAIPG